MKSHHLNYLLDHDVYSHPSSLFSTSEYLECFILAADILFASFVNLTPLTIGSLTPAHSNLNIRLLP